MFRKLVSLCLTIHFFSLIAAQADFPVVVVTTHGKVKSKLESGKCMKSSAGTLLKKTATIDLKKNADAIIYANNRFVSLSDKGKYKIEELASSTMRNAKLNFDPLFGEYIKSAITITSQSGWNMKNNKSMGDGWSELSGLEKGGWGTTDPKDKGGWGTTDPKDKGGWGTTDPKDKGGWGFNDMNIEPACPGGIYKNGENILRWKKSKDVDHYLFCIFDEEVNLVASHVVHDTFVWLDLSKFNLDPQKTFYWQIIAYGQKLVSPPVTFVILPVEDQKEILEVSKNSDIYSKTDFQLNGMMDAVALESNKLNLEALNTYERLFSNYPDNQLLKMLYSSFFIRMGQNSKAKMIMEK